MSDNQSSKVDCVCLTCGVAFQVWRCQVKIGEGKFCSRDCYKRKPLTPLVDRFFRYVGRKAATGCILWVGCTNKDGYGIIGSGGRAGRNLLANRVAYELFRGPIPDGLHVLHACDNPPCINPAHLFLGTQADNMADKKAKGRMHKRKPGSRRYLQELRRRGG